MKKGQLVTCGIFYCRDSAEIKGCGSLQTSSWLDSYVLRSRQQKHTAIRYKQGYKTTLQQLNDILQYGNRKENKKLFCELPSRQRPKIFVKTPQDNYKYEGSRLFTQRRHWTLN